MKYFLKLTTISIITLFVFGGSIENRQHKCDDICITSKEYKLYELINSYRKQKKLPAIPLSKSLTIVAQAHVKDLVNNQPEKGNCNTHSWSDKGKWTSCCYTPDHAQSQCMWNKPRELTSYTGDGFEIAYFTSGDVIPEKALDAWKGSKGHHMVIINGNPWKNFKWNAMGVGIYKGYACVWFGVDKDLEGQPKKCNN